MKSFISVLILGALFSCATRREVLFELPAAMLPHVKEEYYKRCEKGQVLYKMNCAACHDTKKGRREIIPDFKPEQLLGYSLRVSNAKHEKNMPDSLVSEEELGIIMTFLSFKKKNHNTHGQ